MGLTTTTTTQRQYTTFLAHSIIKTIPKGTLNADHWSKYIVLRKKNEFKNKVYKAGIHVQSFGINIYIFSFWYRYIPIYTTQIPITLNKRFCLLHPQCTHFYKMRILEENAKKTKWINSQFSNLECKLSLLWESNIIVSFKISWLVVIFKFLKYIKYLFKNNFLKVIKFVICKTNSLNHLFI